MIESLLYRIQRALLFEIIRSFHRHGVAYACVGPMSWSEIEEFLASLVNQARDQIEGACPGCARR